MAYLCWYFRDVVVVKSNIQVLVEASSLLMQSCEASKIRDFFRDFSNRNEEILRVKKEKLKISSFFRTPTNGACSAETEHRL